MANRQKIRFYRQMRILTTLLFLLSPVCFAETTLSTAPSMSTRISTLETKFKLQQEDLKKVQGADLQNKYAEILERTNQQLGLWSNPYGVMVGTLSALFAAASIIVAIIIYLLTQKQKLLMSEMQSNFQNRLESAIKETEIVRKQIVSDFGKFLQESKDIVENLQKSTLNVTAEQNAATEKAIAGIQAERAKAGSAAVGASFSTWAAMAKGLSQIPQSKTPWFHTCSKCLLNFPIHVNEDAIDPKIECPQCKNVDRVKTYF